MLSLILWKRITILFTYCIQCRHCRFEGILVYLWYGD